jgi:cation:H+ antiporter
MAEEVLASPAGWRMALPTAAGLAVLIPAGALIVTAAEGIGDGLGPFVVARHSLPSAPRRPSWPRPSSRFLAVYAEVGLGTVLGSNIFSNLWIVGVAATLSPAALGAAKCGSQLWTAW